MAIVQIVIQGKNDSDPAFRSVERGANSLGTAMEKLQRQISFAGNALMTWFAADKLIGGFNKGLEAVDEFQQSVIKTAAMITSLQGGDNIASNYAKAKQYAESLNLVLQKVDARTTLNLSNLQSITEEMMKQGVVLNYHNESQVEAFTRLANAAAVYSNNGRNEIQLRQEVAALLRGEVDQNSQLASMMQRMVGGDLKRMVEQWKESGTLLENLGKYLSGFGPAAKDLADTWGAVKSSLKTSIDLVLRAGFTGIVKDMSKWVDQINNYLKTHQDLVANKIKQAWDQVKGVFGLILPIAKEVLEHGKLFVELWIGAKLLGGVTTLISQFTILKDVIIAARTAALGLAAANAGAAATGAASSVGSIASAATGAGVAWTAASGAQYLSSYPGYAAPASSAVGGAAAGGVAARFMPWVGRAGYIGASGAAGYGVGSLIESNFIKGYYGETLYDWIHGDDDRKRDAEIDARTAAIKDSQQYKMQKAAAAAAARKGSGTAESDIPQINLGETPDQINKKIALMARELAAFKETQESKAKLAKGQAENELATLKSRYEQGLESTQTYYSEEKRIALEAAQAESDAAEDYLSKEKKLLEYISSKKSKSPEINKEYLEESARNQKAIGEVQAAQLRKAKAGIESDDKSTEGLRKENEEYQKIGIAVLQAADNYEAAAKAQMDLDKQSVEYQRMLRTAAEGNAAAGDALIAKEKLWANAIVEGRNKDTQAVADYRSALEKTQDEIDALNGKDSNLIQTEQKLRDGVQKERDLRLSLEAAITAGKTAAVAYYSKAITLQEELNKRMQTEISLQQRKDELLGKIVGYNGNTPIYADWYQKQMAATGYVSNSSLLGGTSNSSGFALSTFGMPYTPVADSNGVLQFPSWEPKAAGGSTRPYATYRINEDGTEWLTMGNRGGYITPAGKVPQGDTNLKIDIAPGAVSIVVQGGGNPEAISDAVLNTLARKLQPKLQSMAKMTRAA